MYQGGTIILFFYYLNIHCVTVNHINNHD